MSTFFATLHFVDASLGFLNSETLGLKQPRVLDGGEERRKLVDKNCSRQRRPIKKRFFLLRTRFHF